MKKTYSLPEIEVVVFSEKDIIAASLEEVVTFKHDNSFRTFNAFE